MYGLDPDKKDLYFILHSIFWFLSLFSYGCFYTRILVPPRPKASYDETRLDKIMNKISEFFLYFTKDVIILIVILSFISEINVINTINLLLVIGYYFKPKLYPYAQGFLSLSFLVQIVIPAIYPFIDKHDTLYFVLGCQYRSFLHANLWTTPLLAQVIDIPFLFIHYKLSIKKEDVIRLSIVDKVKVLQNPIISFIYLIIIGMLPIPTIIKLVHFSIGTIGLYVFMIKKYAGLAKLKRNALLCELLAFILNYIYTFNGFREEVVNNVDKDWPIDFATIGLLPLGTPKFTIYLSLLTPILAMLLIHIEWFYHNYDANDRSFIRNMPKSVTILDKIKNYTYAAYIYIRFEIPLFWQMINVLISFFVSFWNKSLLMLILSICHIVYLFYYIVFLSI